MRYTDVSETNTPQDVASVLQSAQSVIDAALQTVTATRATQDTLEENIRTTDEKFQIHNTSEDSHEDIRILLEDIPSMLTDPIVTGPSAVETGTSATFYFSSTPAFLSLTMNSYEVTLPDGTVETVGVKANGDSENWVHTFEGARNSTFEFRVRAIALTEQGARYPSTGVNTTVTITQHLPPDVSGMSTTLPQVITAGATYTFKVGNIIDDDGDFTGFNISCSDVNLTFSQISNCQLNVDYTLTVAADYDGPATIPVVIIAKDAHDLSASRQVNLHLNGKPSITNLVHNLPSHLTAGLPVAAMITGVTDPEDEVVTYDVSADVNWLTFSRSTTIPLNENVTYTVDNSATPGASYTITYTFNDVSGGISTYQVTSTVNVLPDLNNLVATFGGDGYGHDITGTNLSSGRFALDESHPTFTLSLSGAVDSEGETLTYSIINVSTALVLSKTSGIVENETITGYFDDTLAVRGQTYNLTVACTDVNGGVATRTYGLVVNYPLPTSSLNLFRYSESIPGDTTYVATNVITDVDNRDLSFTMVKGDESDSVILDAADTSYVPGTDSFHITAPTESSVARNSTWSLILTLTDGFESATKTINITQIAIPDISTVVVTPNLTEIYGGFARGGLRLALNTFDPAAKYLSANTRDFLEITLPASELQYPSGVRDLTSLYEVFRSYVASVRETTTLTFTVRLKRFRVGIGGTINSITPDSDINGTYGTVINTGDAVVDSSEPLNISIDVLPIDITKQPSIISPTEDQVVTYGDMTATWEALAWDADMTNS